jgi:hypothetical protein
MNNVPYFMYMGGGSGAYSAARAVAYLVIGAVMAVLAITKRK